MWALFVARLRTVIAKSGSKAYRPKSHFLVGPFQPVWSWLVRQAKRYAVCPLFSVRRSAQAGSDPYRTYSAARNIASIEPATCHMDTDRLSRAEALFSEGRVNSRSKKHHRIFRRCLHAVVLEPDRLFSELLLRSPLYPIEWSHTPPSVVK